MPEAAIGDRQSSLAFTPQRGDTARVALTRARIEDQIRRFTLAASDMSQSGAAALRLQITEEVNLSRALETAIVVFYARPFGADPRRANSAGG
jgi:hypothetical protein